MNGPIQRQVVKTKPVYKDTSYIIFFWYQDQFPHGGEGDCGSHGTWIVVGVLVSSQIWNGIQIVSVSESQIARVDFSPFASPL